MTGSTGIVAFLFTDLVSSTEMLDRLGDDAAQVLHRTHFRLLREAVGSHGGHEVKSLGDGLMVVFPSVLDALGCAVAMQQAVHRHNQAEADRPLNVRIGVHAGEPIRDEEDYFGTPVVIAKRLCDSAEGGQIIASELARDLIGSRGSFEFRELGSLSLKGLSQPVPACEVPWEAPAEEPSPAARLPAAFVIDEKTEAVGRGREVAVITERLKEAANGHGSILLIGGEPGIGKSRLMREGSRLAHAEGWQVLLGHAYDSAGMPPYLPFVEALQAYVRACPLDGLKAQLGDDAAQVALVVPEVAQRIELAPGGGADAPRERYSLFESISDFLSAIAATAPAGLLICLEDLHWADESTLLLLEHAARRLAAERVLFLVTHRDSEADMTPALTRTVEGLTRQRLAQRLDVKRLPRDAVAVLLAGLAGREVPQSLIEAVYSETEGNPFFIQEVFTYLAEERRLFDDAGHWRLDLRLDEIDVPQGVRLVIGRRLERVSQECRGVLVRAATIGRAFRFELLQAIADIKGDALLDTIEEAERTYLLRSDPDGRLSFTHELIRQTLLAGASAPRRQRLHLRVAQALEQLHAASLEPYIAEIAEHYRRAGAAGDIERAIDYSLKAGDIAQSLFALEEAESHLRAAADLMQTAGRPPKERADLLARLGWLLYSMGWDKYPLSIDFYSRALALYEESEDTENVAAMHLGLAQVLGSNAPAMDLSRARQHILAAQPTLSSGPARLSQVRLYNALNGLALWQLRTEEGLAAAKRGWEIADEMGQPLQAYLLATGYGSHLLDAGKLKEAFEAWTKARQMANELNAAGPGFATSAIPGVTLTKLGDPREAQKTLEDELNRPRQARTIRRRAILSDYGAALVASGELGRAQSIVHELGEEVFDQSASAYARPELAFRRGNWAEAEQLWRTANERHETGGNRWAHSTFAVALAGLARVRGDFSGAEELLETALAISLDGPQMPVSLSASAELALVYGETRRPEKARPHLERCREILAQGEDWRGLAGRVGLSEAVVAGADGNVDDAERHFEGALAVFRRYSLPWDEAEALLQRGRMYASSRRHRASAAASFDAAIDIYRGHGAGQRWIDRVEAMRSAAARSGNRTIEAVPQYPAGLSEREAEVLRLIASGKSNQQIADELVISVNTVIRHVSNIFAKTGAANRTEAGDYAHRQGLIAPQR